MNLLSLIKKFVNEGEVVDEELTGDLAVDPIASYKASTNSRTNVHSQKYATTEQSQNIQRTRRTTKPVEISKDQTAPNRTTRKIEAQENDEHEL